MEATYLAIAESLAAVAGESVGQKSWPVRHLTFGMQVRRLATFPDSLTVFVTFSQLPSGMSYSFCLHAEPSPSVPHATAMFKAPPLPLISRISSRLSFDNTPKLFTFLIAGWKPQQTNY